MKKKVNIGFDIGITSVGWAIVDEENNIIDRGVRLFEELKNSEGKLKNQERREKRHQRRTIRRRVNRKDDFIKLITNKYFDIFKIEKFDDFDKTKKNFLNLINNVKSDDPNSKHSTLDLILKGLKEEIKPIQLLKVLYYYLSHRGYSYMDYDQYMRKNNYIKVIDNIEELKDFAKWLESNDAEDNKKLIEKKAKEIDFKKIGIRDYKSFLSQVRTYNKQKEYFGKFPSEIQKIEFDKYGYFRGNLDINGSFSKFDWKEEIEKILNNQKYLTKDFAYEYIGSHKKSIFNRLRDFSEGPDCNGKPSKYGLIREDENGEIVTKENLWDYTIGKCCVFVDENRANKKSCSAEIANILNQLNTISIDEPSRDTNKIKEKEKKDIIFEMIKSNTNPLKIISKICGTATNNIYKYPSKSSVKTNKSDENENIEKLKNTKILFELLKNVYKIEKFDDLLNLKGKFNDIIDVFAKYPNNYKKIEIELINNKKLELDEKIVKEILESSNKLDSKNTSNMSLKALDLYIKDELRTFGLTINQKYKNKIDENEVKRFKFDRKSKYINLNCLDNKDFIISPTTRCSFKETIKVLNKILKRYIYNPSNKNKETYFVKNIVLEMPTEWNSRDEKDRITSINNHNKKLEEMVKSEYGYDEENKNIIKKLIMLKSQENTDIYTGEFIDPQQVISNPNYAEIEHIIPYAICFDNSNSNKALALRGTNSLKGRKTPKEFMDNTKFYTMKKKWELWFNEEKIGKDKDKKNEFYNKQKFENLCVDLESDKIRRLTGFIGRNLSDTRYACRIVKQLLDAWIDNNENMNRLSNDRINVLTVNGQYSQRYRGEKFLNIKKDRKKDHSHHAVDATICGILGNSNSFIKKLVWYRKVNLETGEVTITNEYKDFDLQQKIEISDNDIKWKELKENVENFDVKYSYKINKKSDFGSFYGDSIKSVKKDGVNKKGENIYYEYAKLDLFDKDADKVFEKLNKRYEDGNKYDDPKLWNDLLIAYKEGKKIKESSEKYEKINPFKLYMEEYCKTYKKDDFLKYKSVFLRRKNQMGKDYEYSVRFLKYKLQELNNFQKVKEIEKDDIFSAYKNFSWKEIRLFKDNRGEYRVIPMRISLYKSFLHKNNLKNKLDMQKYDEELKRHNISSSKFYKIHKGTLLINKNNLKDIRQVVGGKFERNQLEIKEIYKKVEKENRDKNVKSINYIMENYWFCNIDELGNVKIIKDLGL